MRVVGIATSVTEKTATVSFVVLEHRNDIDWSTDAVTVTDRFEVKVDEAPTAEQLGDLSERVEAHVRSLAVDGVAVRRADVSARPSKKEGPQFRLLLEGAIAGVSRRVVDDTVIRNGRSGASAYESGSSKATIDELAAKLIGEKKYTEATAAALSLLRPQHHALRAG